MGYNTDLDKTLWQSERSPDGLVIKIMQYGAKGVPKIAFMRHFETRDGEMKEKAGGRLDLKDINYFGTYWPQINKLMKNIAATTAGLELPHPDEVDQDKILESQGISIYDNQEQE